MSNPTSTEREPTGDPQTAAARAATEAQLADLETWQDLLEQAQKTQDADLKTAADKWSGTVTTLIGAFATVSVVIAPKALTDFNSNTLRDAAFWLLAVAGLLGLAAISSATYIAQGIPRVDAKMDAAKLKRKTLTARQHGVTVLRSSQVMTVAAVMLVLAASAIASIDALRGSTTAEVDVLVVYQNGSTTCGSVEAAIQGSGVVSTTVVAHC